jgi:O-succinylbenzoate synthase
VLAALPYPAKLEAALLLRANRLQDGEGIYVKLEQSMRSMRGPDGWVDAIFGLESIAREARDAGDWELAQYTAQQMIQHDPYYAGGHFAFALVAEHSGETQGSHEMFAQAEKLWAHADENLPELAVARKGAQ